ncbi:Mast/stem cell growth factor receptor [Balamuthia mandrillaris]
MQGLALCCLLILLPSFLGPLVSATFRFKGITPVNPTPGTEVTLQWETVDDHAMIGGYWRFTTLPIFEVEYRYDDTADANYRWSCPDSPPINFKHYCYRPEPATTTPDTVFSATFIVPPQFINGHVFMQAALTTGSQTGEIVYDQSSTLSSFMTGNASCFANPYVSNHVIGITPGEVFPWDLVVTNYHGPSNARDVTCLVQLTVEGTDSWGTPPSGCTEQGDMTWSCVSSEDIPPRDSTVPPDYRSNIFIRVGPCTALAEDVDSSQGSLYIPKGVPSWDISTHFSESSGHAIEMDNIVNITTVFQNDGPSTSLSSRCTWRFSVSALSLEAVSGAARSCSLSTTTMPEVSCDLDVLGSTATTTVLSVSAKPELAGIPSFGVTLECVDERGDSLPSAATNILVTERLDGVNMKVEIVNAKIEDPVQKRQQYFTEDELGTTDGGQVIFKEALMFIVTATSEGAHYARNITCDVHLGGSDAPLLASSPLFSSSSASSCKETGTNENLLWTCLFEELWLNSPNSRNFVLIPDVQMEEFDVAVECTTNYPQAISNPVFQRTFQFVHVSNIPEEADRTSSGSDSSSLPEDNNGLVVGLSLGLGLPFLLIIAAVVAVLVILRRRTVRRLERQNEEDMEQDAALEVYATAKSSSFEGRKKRAGQNGAPVKENYQRNSTWEIPYSELEFDEEIGRGCFGTVWRGTWRETTVAIKMFNSIMDSEMGKANFKAECEIMKHLRPHTNVMQLFGVSMEDGTPWCLVMEYLAQGNLLQFLQQQHSSKTKKKTNATAERNKMAVRMAREIAAGMHHLHSENIVHRDLAARNILLTGDLTVKVADFGLSTANSDEEQTETIPIRWTPPEFFMHRTFDRKSDVWSYGVLLWEIMNAGKTPYTNRKTEEVINAVVEGKILLRLDEDSPAVLRNIMAQCFRFDPEERPTFKDIVKMLKEDKEWR